MKRSWLFGLAVGLLLTLSVLPAMAQSVEFRSERIAIQYDNQFHQHVRWLRDQGRNIITFDPAAQETMEVNGWECAEFIIDPESVSQKRIEDPEFGPALEGMLKGVLRDQQKQIALERRVRLLLPDRFADVVIFEKSYRNLGDKPAQLGRVYSQRVLLDRAAAESGQPSYLFASFQGGAYKWGKDYSLIWLQPDPYLEVCVCAMPHSPYYMPYYPIANASDPTNLVQVRQRVKLEKAIRGPTFCVGDCYQVPMDEWKGYSVPESFETAMGTGAQLTTFYAHLSDAQREKWIRWFRLSAELGLSSGEYLNLYDLAFDKPEIHVVRQGKDLFYGVFADLWPMNRPIELRGLSKGTAYEVYDYANERPLGVVSGAKPHLNVAFKDSLLIRVRPQ